jgi:hypothetical protein
LKESIPDLGKELPYYTQNRKKRNPLNKGFSVFSSFFPKGRDTGGDLLNNGFIIDGKH